MEKMPEDVRVKLFMHAAGMLERIEIGNPMGIEEHCEEVILRNMAWFQLLSKTIVQSFQPIGYEIPRAEHYYFMLSLPGKIE